MRLRSSIALALAASVATCPLAAAAAPKHLAAKAGLRTLPGRLPAEVVPVSYEVFIDSDAAKLTFRGKVTVQIEVRAATRRLVLNALDIAFDKAELDGRAIGLPSLNAADQTAAWNLKAQLKPGRHKLVIDYRGKIYQEAAGLFALDYDTLDGKRRALFTQFENSDARRMVPSWDEPGRRATFSLSIRVDGDQMAISNTPIEADLRIPSGRQRSADTGPVSHFIRFKTTPKMSSYLLFLAIGDLERTTARASDGTEIGIVTRKGAAANGAFALKADQEILPWYNDYFARPYPLPKLDQVAGPGSSQFFGAMENWGAIFYFDKDLLTDPATTTEARRQRIWRVVAHETAHQWFGDLVTMSWWDDLWLNEGFANWMESKAVQHFHPEWRPEVDAVNGREKAMGLDSREGSHPVVQHIENVDQAAQAFDNITYDKGEAVIRMIEAYVGDDAWRTGVRRYIKKHALGNTVSDDLWAEMEAASNKPVKAIAHDFTLQTGVPLVRVVSQACSAGKATVSLEQERFGTDTVSKQPQRWHVPVTVRLAPPVIAPTEGDTSLVSVTDRKLILDQGRGAVTLPGCEPAIVNAGQTGYFRVLYSGDHLARLGARFAAIGPADQLGLLSDSWALGQAGYGPMADYLDLSRHVPLDADPLVWGQVVDAYGALDELYAGQPGQARWRAFGRKALAPLMARVGWEAKADEAPNVATLRENLIRTLGAMGDPAVMAEAKKRFDGWLADPNSLDASLRGAVLKLVMSRADRTTWELVHARAVAATNPQEKEDLYVHLADAADPALQKRTLELAVSDEPPPTTGPDMIRTVSLHDPDGAFAFALQRLPEVMRHIEGSSSTRYVPSLAQGSADPATLSALKAWADKNVAAAARRPVNVALSAIAFRVEVRQKRLPEVDRWLAEHAGN